MSAVPKLRFPEYDGEWLTQPLNRVAKLTSSKRVYLSDYTETGVPFFRGKEITELEKGIIPDDILFISREAFERFRGKFGAPQTGDILITAVGTLANIFRVRAGQEFYFKDGNLIWLREVQQHPEFLEIYLKFIRPAILRSAIGSSQKALTIVALNKLELKLPTHPEQQKIASFLSSVDKKIDLLRQKKAELELYKKGLMQKIFSQEVRFAAEDGSDFPDWEEVTVGDMAERHVRGLTSSMLNFLEVGYPVYGASGVIGYIADYLSDQKFIGVVKDGAGVGRVFEAVEKSSLLSTMESIVPKPGFSFGFVKQIIKDIDFKKFTTGSTIPHVYFKDYSKESYPCPSFDEQEKIAHLLETFDVKIQKTSSQIEEMETFKKGLLQQMFV